MQKGTLDNGIRFIIAKIIIGLCAQEFNYNVTIQVRVILSLESRYKKKHKCIIVQDT